MATTNQRAQRIADEELREGLRDLSGPRLVRVSAGFRPGSLTGPTDATKLALRSLAKRYLALKKEVRALDQELDRLTAEACPQLLALFGAGPDTAGALALRPATTPSACARRPRSRSSAAPPRSRHRPGRRRGTG